MSETATATQERALPACVNCGAEATPILPHVRRAYCGECAARKMLLGMRVLTPWGWFLARVGLLLRRLGWR